jgi:hypothetical protein
LLIKQYALPLVAYYEAGNVVYMFQQE